MHLIHVLLIQVIHEDSWEREEKKEKTVVFIKKIIYINWISIVAWLFKIYIE